MSTTARPPDCATQTSSPPLSKINLRLCDVGTFRVWLAVNAGASIPATLRIFPPGWSLWEALVYPPGSASALVQGSQPMISDLGFPHPRSRFFFDPMFASVAYARTQQGTWSCSASPTCSARDRRSLTCGRGLGVRGRGTVRSSWGGRPAGSGPERDAGQHTIPRHNPDRRTTMRLCAKCSSCFLTTRVIAP